jgi:integrase
MSVRREKRRDREGAAREFWFVDFVFEHADGRKERVRKVSPVQTRRGAEQYERDLRLALLDGSRKERREAPRFAAFVEEYLTTYAEPNNKYSTVTAKKSTFKHHLLPAFGRHKLDEITLREIEGYKARKLATGLSPKSVNNHLTILRKLLSVAVDWELLSFVPKVKWLKGPLPEFDFFDFDECERFLAIADVEWRPMFTVAARTGLRIGELRALQWDDVDLVRGRLVVRRNVWRGHAGTPKSGRNREIPLSDDAMKALKGQRHLRGKLVFCAEGGRQLEENECKWPIWRACKRAGLRPVSWHVLRHTFASHLVMRGVPLKAVQELLGHSTIEMTMRYAHLSPDVRRNAVQLLDHGNTVATQATPEAKVPILQ